MKKIISTFALACIAFTLTGCSHNTPMEDCLNTNIGTSNYNQIMKTENGYYYNSTMINKMSLKYHDTTTGNDIYLCAKPECTHDGDKFCTATSEGFHTHYTGLYGNNIYIAATEADGKHVYYKLLKASLNGTELTEICTFIQTGGSNKGIAQLYEDNRAMILHRGYAFIPYYLSANETRNMGSAGIAIVNLSDGSVQYLPEYERSEAEGYTNITPYGDYIYYTYTMNYLNDLSKTEMHRYNFITGEDELLPVKENLQETYGTYLSATELKNYTIIDDKVWYICGNNKSMFIYDPNANTTTLVEEFEEKLLTKTEEYDENGVLYAIHAAYYANPKLQYDGKYLYIAERGFFASEYGNENVKVHIFTLEGDRLGGFVFERKGSAFDGTLSSCQINILDETFYIQTKEGTVFCPVSNVISGNIEWKELYQFEKGEY